MGAFIWFDKSDVVRYNLLFEFGCVDLVEYIWYLVIWVRMFALVVLFGMFVLAGLISKITKISKMGHQRILRKSMFSHVPVLESMSARQPGLQAPNNLTGSKIKNTHFFPLSILSQRNDIQYWEKYLYHVRLTVSCLFSEGKGHQTNKICVFAGSEQP